MMGDANIFYMEKEFDKAIPLLKELIKENPTVPDPYHTLGMIYEEQEDKPKAVELFFLAAHLTPEVGDI